MWIQKLLDYRRSDYQRSQIILLKVLSNQSFLAGSTQTNRQTYILKLLYLCLKKFSIAEYKNFLFQNV